MTELESKKVSIDAGDRVWTVTNYDHTYLGRVSLARALVSSDNTVYAQLTDLVLVVDVADPPDRSCAISQYAPNFARRQFQQCVAAFARH